MEAKPLSLLLLLFKGDEHLHYEWEFIILIIYYYFILISRYITEKIGL